MNFYDRLTVATEQERAEFRAIPLVRTAVQSGASRALYLAFLSQAYHHVKHTFPLLALAASCTRDARYQSALLEYMQEECGHEQWILDDIRALGGDDTAVRNGVPGMACRVMVGYSYYAIERVSPYALLGSVYVLEGMSVALATAVADSVQKSIGYTGSDGFSYLRSHGDLDVKHVAFFENVVSGISDRSTQDVIVDSAKIFFRLYGDIFRELGRHHGVTQNVA